MGLKYIDQLVGLIKSNDIESEVVKDLRLKLRFLLRETNCYKTKIILEKILESKLYYESTILYSKMGDHESALTVFVQQLRDHQMAQKYCSQLSSDNNNLFHKLLEIYLTFSQRFSVFLVKN